MRLSATRPGRFRLLDQLPSFLRSGDLTDVCLRSKDDDGTRSSLKVHRVIMALASEPFATLFAGPFREGGGQSDGEKMDVVELDASFTTLRIIVDFIYKGEAEFYTSGMAVFEVLRVAHLYRLTDLLDVVLAQVTVPMSEGGLLDAELCTTILAETHVTGLALPALTTVLEDYALEHFEACTRLEGFERWPSFLLSKLLSNAALVAPAEEIVLHAVSAWHRANPDRATETALLLRSIRFPLLSSTTRGMLRESIDGLGPRLGNALQQLLDEQDCVTPRRRVSSNPYWPDLGCSLPGGVVVAGGRGCGKGPGQLQYPEMIALVKRKVTEEDEKMEEELPAGFGLQRGLTQGPATMEEEDSTPTERHLKELVVTDCGRVMLWRLYGDPAKNGRELWNSKPDQHLANDRSLSDVPPAAFSCFSMFSGSMFNLCFLCCKTLLFGCLNAIPKNRA